MDIANYVTLKWCDINTIIYISGDFSKKPFFASNTYALFSTHSEWNVHTLITQIM
jgi:hypothetical protein